MKLLLLSLAVFCLIVKSTFAVDCHVCQTLGDPQCPEKTPVCKNADYCTTVAFGQISDVVTDKSNVFYQHDCVWGTLLDVTQVGKWSWGMWEGDVKFGQYIYACNDADGCNNKAAQIPEQPLPDLIHCKEQQHLEADGKECKGHFCYLVNMTMHPHGKHFAMGCGFGIYSEIPTTVNITQKVACQVLDTSDYSVQTCVCASGDDCNVNLEPEISEKLSVFECPLDTKGHHTCMGHYCVAQSIPGLAVFELGCQNTTDSLDDHGVGCMLNSQVNTCRCKGKCDVKEMKQMDSNKGKFPDKLFNFQSKLAVAQKPINF